MSALVPKVTCELTKMKRTLRDVFGLDKLRPGQAAVIRSVLEGKNTLAIMPTGAGKSLCYQLPALHIPGTTLVVSPLISLMKDQVDKLGHADVEASQLNSSLTTSEQQENLEQIEKQSSDFIFVTPERRWQILHDYFGEQMESNQCGVCDNCVSPPEQQFAVPEVRQSVSV